MPWRPTLDALKLKREKDALAFQLLRTREQLETAERHRIGVEVMLDVRGERIDQLSAKIDQLREQNRRLDQEAERLAEMVRLAPQFDEHA